MDGEHSWALHYPGGRVVEQCPWDASIAAAPRGADALAAKDAGGRVVAIVDLTADGRLWRPIFYHRCVLEVGDEARAPWARLVFGRARIADQGLVHDLYAQMPWGGVRCPAALFDRPVLERQVQP